MNTPRSESLPPNHWIVYSMFLDFAILLFKFVTIAAKESNKSFQCWTRNSYSQSLMG